MYLKNLYIVLVLTALVSFSSCNKDERNFFEARLEANFEIMPGLNTLETHYFLIRDVNSFYLQNLNSRGWSLEDVENITASRGILGATFGGIDFDFVERLSVHAISHVDRSIKKEMFYLDGVPLSQGNNIKMLTSISDLTEILQEEHFDIEVRLKFRQFPPFGLNCLLDFGYLVYAKN